MDFKNASSPRALFVRGVLQRGRPSSRVLASCFSVAPSALDAPFVVANAMKSTWARFNQHLPAPSASRAEGGRIWQRGHGRVVGRERRPREAEDARGPCPQSSGVADALTALTALPLGVGSEATTLLQLFRGAVRGRRRPGDEPLRRWHRTPFFTDHVAIWWRGADWRVRSRHGGDEAAPFGVLQRVCCRRRASAHTAPGASAQPPEPGHVHRQENPVPSPAQRSSLVSAEAVLGPRENAVKASCCTV